MPARSSGDIQKEIQARGCLGCGTLFGIAFLAWISAAILGFNFTDDRGHYGLYRASETLTDATPEQTDSPATSPPSEAAAEPAGYPGGEKQRRLDDACLGLQSAFAQIYDVTVGCEWTFPNGSDAPAVLILHLPRDQARAAHRSRDAWIASANSILIKEHHGVHEPFARVVGGVTLDD